MSNQTIFQNIKIEIYIFYVHTSYIFYIIQYLGKKLINEIYKKKISLFLNIFFKIIILKSEILYE